jgi:CHAT domain-containing protein/tetratricopeptide (TPR) repeat protein
MPALRRPLWWLAGLAVAAGAWAAVRFDVAGWGPGRDARSRQLDALVSAIDTRRIVEPRLAGGFAYGPLPSARRAAAPALSEFSPDVRIAVAELEKLEMRERTPDTLALVGAAYLAIGDAARAVPALEEASASPSPKARVRSDLAAAYLVRALDANNAQDVPRALAAADLAAKADPSLAEARFNRALALEQLHLDAESQDAWKDYLQVDGSSAWASEARSHLLVASASPAASGAEERHAIEAAADSETTALASAAVRPIVQPGREWTEEQLLVAWPEAQSKGDRESAATIVRRAGRIAESIALVTGDSYLADAVAAVQRTTASRAAATELARAHAAFRQAMTRYENNEFVESGRQFAGVLPGLERAGSPFAASARLQVAISAYYASEIDASARELDALIPSIEPRRYVRLLGLTHRMRGLVESVRARYGDSFAHNLRALDFFEAAADRENIAAIESSLAENLEFLGEPRLAWMHRARALAGLSEVRSLRRRHTILVSSVLSCLRQGSPEAASYFQSAVLANATRWNKPEALAEAHVRQAELHGQLGDLALVASELAEARRWMAMVPPGSLSRQVDARIMLASASFAGNAAARLDVSGLTDALAYLKKAGLNWGLAKAYLARGKAYGALGRPDLAEQDFLDGIQEFEKQRSTLTAETLRVSYFDQPWDLFTEMIRLQAMTRGRPDAALGFAERGRARTLLEAVVGSEAVPFDVPALQQGMQPDTAIVYYSVLDYDVLVWRLTKTRVESFESSIVEADLERLVNRFRAEIGETSSRARDTAAQLYDLLVRTAVRDLPPQTTVVFVPDGVLHAVPFAALVDRGTGRYLIQDLSIAVAPSASVFIAATAAERDRRPASSRTALVMGNPSTGRPGSPALPDLPDADREVREIAALYSTTDIVRAADATKRRFLDEFDRYDVVHFAGHGISNTDFPALSRLVFAGVDGGATDSLFAQELAGLRFRRTQVLVLAACQTSGGRVRRGEGVLSLARPFLAAGVPTVVASLWDADDRATRALLVPFHAALREGVPPARALRSAQLAALSGPDASLVPPSTWAGFVVVGAIGSPATDNPVARQGR